jgi:hypothetical protein
VRCSTSNTLLLCPHCCASDMFARSGAVHAFFRQQLALLTTVHQQELADNDVRSPALSDDFGRLALDESNVSARCCRRACKTCEGCAVFWFIKTVFFLFSPGRHIQIHSCFQI